METPPPCAPTKRREAGAARRALAMDDFEAMWQQALQCEGSCSDSDASRDSDEDEYAQCRPKKVLVRLPCGDIHVCGRGAQ